MKITLTTLIKNRNLILPFCERDLKRRYRGSTLGLIWSLLQPLSMLGVYTFIFSVVFKARWSSSMNSQQDNIYFFALNLFAGLLVVNLFGESINRSSDLIVSNTNYVKKVIFPLEILPITVISTATINASIGMGILVIASWLTLGFSAQVLWLPWIWLPLILLSAGASWLISAIGVFVRDIGQIVSLFLSILLFVTPVFYPISILPPKLQTVLSLNPLAAIVEETRTIIINHQMPDSKYILLAPLFSLIVAELSLRFFLRSKPSFADVL